MRRIIRTLALATLTGCADAPAPVTQAAAPPPAEPVGSDSITRSRILFVGTSLSAGYGVGADVAFPAIIQQLIDSAGLPFRVENAGLSGETSAGGLRRADWLLQRVPDVLVVELGANDGLRGIDPAEMQRNLDGIVSLARAKNAALDVVILGMEAPPNLGDDYTAHFRRVFADVARKHDARLVPFLLEGVAGNAVLNIEDGMHPTAEGHRVIAGIVWQVLGPVLAERARQRASTDPS